MNTSRENICTCVACHYTFNAAVICKKPDSVPHRCPDCGKKSVDGQPSVRAATEAEVQEYHLNQETILNEIAEELCPSYYR